MGNFGEVHEKLPTFTKTSISDKLTNPSHESILTRHSKITHTRTKINSNKKEPMTISPKGTYLKDRVTICILWSFTRVHYSVTIHSSNEHWFWQGMSKDFPPRDC